MSRIIGPNGERLDRIELPPQEQRIIAPSVVDVVNSDMGNASCVCALRVTDMVKLAMYYVPMTPDMCLQVSEALADVVTHRSSQDD